MTPVGVVLAGGAGRRMGGGKAAVLLDGVPLLHRVLAPLSAVTDAQAVVARADTQLPLLDPAVKVWREADDGPRHPAHGIAHAIERAGGRAVLCVAVDLPLLDAATLRVLLAGDDGRSPCVVARVAGELEPLCALWRPTAAATLARAGKERMRQLVATLDPCVVDVPDPTRLTNVNTPDDLRRAQCILMGGTPGP
ncbi:MAG: molybdenum cofactor guanylyltransferase [Solirubrobacterales bacterium]|nr:molybdenum cofactor guanylyltransferase [Solirubrobacterales bacterium]